MKWFRALSLFVCERAFYSLVKISLIFYIEKTNPKGLSYENIVNCGSGLQP
jgi:hypothetical protein